MTPALPALADLLEQGRREGVAPALSAAVLHRGALVHASWHGAVPRDARSPFAVSVAPARSGAESSHDEGETRPLAPDDVFDVASLTKPLATSTIAAQLVAERALDLDAPVAPALPGFEQGGKEAVTARHLLAHVSGLVWWRPWFERAAADPIAGRAFLPPAARPPPAALAGSFRRGREIVRAAILAETLQSPPGVRAVYSDAGFLALGFLLEALAAEPLARLAERRVFEPLGLRSTFFLDGLDPGRAAAHAAGRSFVPTERCEHRHEVNRGAVNDDNAWAVGGAAGHAGLFSTALEVAALGQAWLDALQGRRSIVPAAAAAEFARRDATPGTTRTLGWDTRSVERSSLGTRLGLGRRGALGHLGFTGTSLWIDLDGEVVVALLTNRVHPSRDNERIREFRPRFHDAVAEGVGVG